METQVAAALASFLPYLLRAGKRVGDQAADALATEAGRLAGDLWSRLRDKVLGNPVAKASAEDLAERPGDSRAVGAFALQLEKILATDAALRRDVEAILQGGQSGSAAASHDSVAVNQQASTGGVNIGGSNTGTIRTTGR